MSTGLLVTLAVVVILVIWIVSIYNNLVALRNNRENAFANIDVQLKQRYDLIPQPTTRFHRLWPGLKCRWRLIPN